MHQRTRELHPPPIAAAEFCGLVFCAVLEAEPCKFSVDTRLRGRVRYAMQAGVEQKIGGHRELKIEGGLLEYDAELRQRRHGIARHVVTHDLDTAAVGKE